MSYVLITRDKCNFCDEAKALLRGATLPFTQYNVDSGSSKWVLTLLRKSGLNTVPQIFKPDGTHVGGHTELKELLIETRKKEF